MTQILPSVRRHWLRLLLWLAALALLAVVLQTVSLPAVWQVLGQLGVDALLALTAANSLVLITMTGRWWLLLRAWGYSLPYAATFGYRLAAFGVSYFTPGPQFGGEPLQVYLVRRHHRVPTDIAVAAVTLDKLLELLVNFSFLAGGVLLIAQQQLFSTQAAGAMAAFSAGLLALPVGVMIMLAAGRTPLSDLLQMVTRIASPLAQPLRCGRWAAGYTAAIESARSSETRITAFYQTYPGTLALALLVSILSWAMLVGEYWLMVWILGAELTLLEALVALTAARLAFLVPLPGGLGALEASQVLAMSILGFEPAIG
jgi:uncharacterized protein (TIRG00374 family)